MSHPSLDSVDSTDLFSDSLTTLAWTLGSVVVIMLVVVLVLPVVGARLYRKRSQLSDAQRERWRAAVLDFVKDGSPGKGDTVSLGRLWKGSGLSTADRFVILEPLLKSRVLTRAYSNDSVTQFFQHVIWSLPGRPPRYVTLSERDWTQMASGAKARTVIKKQVIRKKEVMKTKIGDVTGSAVAVGKRARAENSVQHLSTLDPSDAHRLVAGLRDDARTLPAEASEEAESSADSLELDVRSGRTDSALRRANAVIDTVTKAAGLWPATAAILRTLGVQV